MPKKLKKKVGCDFSSLASHVSIPSPLSLSPFATPKVFSLILFSWLHQIRKSRPSFSTLFFVLVPSSSFALTWQPSLSHQNNISFSKEEIKRLTLKFQFQNLWVSNQNFICLFLLLSSILILEAEL